MTTFLCTGDWHVGAGMDYAADRLADQRQTVERIVDLAIEHDVDAVLLAGDLWHLRRPTPAQLLAVWEPLRRLAAETDVEICAINGNHCVEAADGPVALDLFADFVDVYRQPGLWHAPAGVTVACLPWAPVARLVATRGGGDRDDLNREAAGLLLAAARGLRAEIPDSQPAVLMTHFSISGASTPTGVATDDFREVVLELADLEALGFDAVVAGHIHKAQRLDDIADVGRQRPVFYTGSPAPVDFGEATVDHGVALLNIDGPRTLCTFLPVESRPFVTLECDLTSDDTSGLAYVDLGYAEKDQPVDGAVVRVRYRATEEQARRVSHHEISKALYDAGAHKVYVIQPTILRETRVRVAGVDEDLAPLAALELWADAEQLDEPRAKVLRDLTSRYLEAVPA